MTTFGEDDQFGPAVPGIVITNTFLDNNQTEQDNEEYIYTYGTAQSFIANETGNLGKVELLLRSQWGNSPITVNLRQDTPTGNILGVATLSIQGQTSQWYTFNLGNVKVKKGACYVIEVISSRNTPAFWSDSYQNPYPNGNGFQAGYVYPNTDFAFRTYIQKDVHIWEKEQDTAFVSVRETGDGNYIVAGTKGNIYLAKIDECGNNLWEKVHADTDGSSPDVEIFKAAHDSSGNIIWQKMSGYNMDEKLLMEKTYNMILAKDGSIIVCATLDFKENNISGYKQDIGILKFDRNGNHLWSKIYRGSGSEDCGWQIAETSDGGYILAALTNAVEITGGGFASLVLKLNSNGNVEWQHVFNLLEAQWPEMPSAIFQTSDGKYLLSLETGNFQGAVIKFDQSGKIWQYIDNYSECKGLIEDTDGYLIFGFKRNLDADINIIKLNQNGQFIWEKSIDHSGIEDYWGDRSSPYQKVSDGYIFGCNTSNGYYLVKLDQDYQKVWERVYGKPDGYSYKRLISLCQTSDGGYIVTGEWTIKLDNLGRDVTRPAAISLINDGSADDIDLSNSQTELAANWATSSDEESGISGYWYAIGTTPGGTDILDWTDNGANCSVSLSGLSLIDGMKYYFSVKAENGIGLYSQSTSSDGLVVHSAPVGILGDVNGDGLVTINDALMTARVASGIEVPNFNRILADVNRDGKVDINDALLISKYAAGLITEF